MCYAYDILKEWWLNILQLIKERGWQIYLIFILKRVGVSAGQKNSIMHLVKVDLCRVDLAHMRCESTALIEEQSRRSRTALLLVLVFEMKPKLNTKKILSFSTDSSCDEVICLFDRAHIETSFCSSCQGKFRSDESHQPQSDHTKIAQWPGDVLLITSVGKKQVE